ncbi:hypothetical protein OH76DRAFT_1020602 [Lentinus brumalis]|uniref:Uncharacterized protein n=1 Tax=Lentinus brumalis TaxID=2498619 RepID=A0A371CXV9_9APHY|nr:hypothetical protein OH76DRAFT_1020602 [Polyporus brumalis]
MSICGPPVVTAGRVYRTRIICSPYCLSSSTPLSPFSFHLFPFPFKTSVWYSGSLGLVYVVGFAPSSCVYTCHAYPTNFRLAHISLSATRLGRPPPPSRPSSRSAAGSVHIRRFPGPLPLSPSPSARGEPRCTDGLPHTFPSDVRCCLFVSYLSVGKIECEFCVNIIPVPCVRLSSFFHPGCPLFAPSSLCTLGRIASSGLVVQESLSSIRPHPRIPASASAYTCSMYHRRYRPSPASYPFRPAFLALYNSAHRHRPRLSPPARPKFRVVCVLNAWMLSLSALSRRPSPIYAPPTSIHAPSPILCCVGASSCMEVWVVDARVYDVFCVWCGGGVGGGGVAAARTQCSDSDLDSRTRCSPVCSPGGCGGGGGGSCVAAPCYDTIRYDTTCTSSHVVVYDASSLCAPCLMPCWWREA